MVGDTGAAQAQYVDLLAKVPQPDLETPFYKAWKREQTKKDTPQRRTTQEEAQMAELLKILGIDNA